MGFFLNFIIALIIEFTIFYLILNYLFKDSKNSKNIYLNLFLIVFFFNILTQSTFLFLIPFLFKILNFSYLNYVIIGEILVFLVEGYILYSIFSKNITLKLATFTSFIANFASWQFTPIIVFLII